MERLVIDVPEEKSMLVKQVLKEFGVQINDQDKELTSFQQKLLNVSVWSEDDIKEIESIKPFEGLKPIEW